MSINYTWEFNPLESYPTASGQTDVVFKAHWQLYASTGSYTEVQIGVQDIASYESGSSFIPYNELTKEIVFGWVTASMETQSSGSVEARYLALSQSLYNRINPPILIQQAPWTVSGSL